MFGQVTCTETVSIVWAIVFGADGACVDIGMSSVLGGIAAFVGCVVMLRFLGSWLLRRIFPSIRGKSGKKAEFEDEVSRTALEPLPYESPIRSTGAWGSKPR